MSNGFENLEVWKKSKDFVIEIYKITDSFPGAERYSMTDQIRRAANSIAANIAEGSGRMSKAELSKFLYYSNGSLQEVKSFLIVAKELGYISDQDFNILLSKITCIGNMLGGLIKSLKA